MSIITLAKDLFNGVKEEDLNRLDSISTYNHNYYDYNGKLLLGVSDDVDFTQWFWVRGSQGVFPIGGSSCMLGDVIIVDEAYT